MLIDSILGLLLAGVFMFLVLVCAVVWRFVRDFWHAVNCCWPPERGNRDEDDLEETP